MAYKTILVHADRSPHAPQRIRVAAELALAFEAHLVGSAMTGIPRFLYQDAGMALAGTVIDAELDSLYKQAEAALDGFEQEARKTGLASIERRLLTDDPGGGLALQARYADLVVVSQADRADPVARTTADLPEYVMLNSGRPVLLVPHGRRIETGWKRIVVAWDAGLEATRAITGALPLLQRAEQVTLVVLNPNWRHGEQPGADMGLYLARHGVRCVVESRDTEEDDGIALLEMAEEASADCLVLGGYGHARFRELLLGGVTDTVLRRMTLPVLMAH